MTRRDSQIPHKIYLDENQLPNQWYNIIPDLITPLGPLISPQTGKPCTADDLSAIFPPAVVEQELSKERFIDIPEPVMELYRQYRPAPLHRAYALEKALGTPAKIYYKYEGNSPSGSHKLNTAIPQVYYNKQAGITRIATETGAGQWGCALSIACKIFGLECAVYMVRVSYDQKPYRRFLMQTYGARVIQSPSMETAAGRGILAEDPDCTGSLGIAISEAVEVAASRADTKYALGSVMNHVCIHQSIIGLEAKKQLALYDEYPDIVIGCNGGGSNFAGIAAAFARDKIKDGKNTRFIAVEPTACPTLTQGVYAYDYGDTAKLTPLQLGYTLGHTFVPAGIHAGGLRYHGDSSIVSNLYHDKVIDAVAVPQKKVFESALLFAQSEMIIPAPESAHAIAATIDEALAAKENNTSPTILFCLSGHGNFDMVAYEKYMSGIITDIAFSGEDLAKSLPSLPKVEL